MAVSFKHAFTSAKVDGGDSTLIQPSNWNAEHTLTMAAGKLLGRDTSGAGAVQELNLAVDPTGQSVVPPSGDTASRPATGVSGMFRYNSTLNKYEGYNGTTWGSIPFEGIANPFTIGSIDIGHASDTTVSRLAPGILASEGRALPVILGQSASPMNVSGTSLTTFATITVPGGAMGANGFIEIQTWLTVNSNANFKTFQVVAAGNAVCSFDLTTGNSYTTRTTTIANRNSTTSQIVLEPTAQYSVAEPFSLAPATGLAFDTSVDWTIQFKGDVSVITDTCRLEAYRVTLYHRP